MSFASATNDEVRTLIGALNNTTRLLEDRVYGRSVFPETANPAEILELDAAIADLIDALAPVVPAPEEPEEPPIGE